VKAWRRRLRPLWSKPASLLAHLILAACGWRAVGRLPKDQPKIVLVAAPHTSNWDGLIMIFAGFALDCPLAWLGKQELFHGPGTLLRLVGGIPVDRQSAHQAATAAVRALNDAERMALAIPPEGTREKTDGWKLGFYLIARRAKVPIVLGYVDYRRRRAGLGPAVWPSGNVDADLEIMRRFYDTISARYPDQVSPIRPTR
jgi:1-acyl-sn-glycerol-3-phosphate acyltransferase